MTAAFVLQPPRASALPETTPQEPPPSGNLRFPGAATAVDVKMDWSTIEGTALLALLLRAAYLDDLSFLNTGVAFIPDYKTHSVLVDPALNGFRPVVVECQTYCHLILHGVKTSDQYRAIALDYLVPRYTAGTHQYLSTAMSPGDFILSWMSHRQNPLGPINLVAHSFGGVLGSYVANNLVAPNDVARATFFGAPKLGPSPSGAPVRQSALTTWATREDPVVGLPPSFIRLSDIALLLAVYPTLFGLIGAGLIKARLDSQWSVLESAQNNCDSLGLDVTVGELENIDNGTNWYQRTGLTLPGVLTGQYEGFSGHKIAEYYNRLRGLFLNWSRLSDAAGAGGVRADQLAAAITVAELGV